MTISAHKFPVETGCFENKNETTRICPLCCEGTGNEIKIKQSQKLDWSF